jgi:hypothetical protein
MPIVTQLIKNRVLISLLSAFVLSISGCASKMTYEEFVARFQQDCPQYYLVRDLAPHKIKTVCDCMLQTTQKNYPNMQSLLAGIRKFDREPRGETDYVPSAIRMAAPSCIKPVVLNQGE